MNQPPRNWHTSVSPELREHMVGKLIKAIIPYPDPAILRDRQRIENVVTYARNAEKDIFEAAYDKEAYYQMLAEKIGQERMIQRLNEVQLAADGI
uniref:KIX domain-containing protein n=1 Tax=Globodera rostochiensis TaxID=31243 RepID=A0A914I2P5_GLORO